jgi:hypothetical protein
MCDEIIGLNMCGMYFLFIEQTITIVLEFRYDRSRTDFILRQTLDKYGNRMGNALALYRVQANPLSVKREDFV